MLNQGFSTTAYFRRLAVSFGLVVLVLMITAVSVASKLLLGVQEEQENRLLADTTAILGQSFANISHAGKYQTRQLLKDIFKQVGSLEYIAIIHPDGRVLIHTDQSKEGTALTLQELATLRDDLTKPTIQIRVLRQPQGRVREAGTVYKGGYGPQTLGAIWVGMNLETSRQATKEVVNVLLLVLALLTLVGIGAVFLLSRGFGASMHRMASQLEGILAHAPLCIAIQDRKGQLASASALFHTLRRPVSPPTLLPQASIPSTDVLQGCLNDIFAQVFSSGASLVKEQDLLLGNARRSFHVHAFPISKDTQQQVLLACAVADDITDRKNDQTNLLLSRMVFDNATEGILITDANGLILEVNRAFEHITGYAHAEAVGSPPSFFGVSQEADADVPSLWHQLLEQGRWEGECWDRRRNGERYPAWISLTGTRDAQGRTTHYVGIFSDISRMKAAEVELQRLAYHDSLTGLPNRTLLHDRLGQEIAKARRHGTKVAILFLDLDRFKVVNDTLGHGWGDTMLQEVSRRISLEVRKTDTLARMGGDEFLLLLPEITELEAVRRVASKLSERLASNPVVLQGREYPIGASIGIAIYPDDGIDIETLIRNADTAMYRAKDKREAGYQFYSPEFHTLAVERMTLEQDLHLALQGDDLLLHYQPKIDLQTGEVVGMEALARWRHPTKGMIPPNQFIGLAEETGLIVPLGRRILEQACREVVALNANLERPLRLAVNLSARQFQRSDLVETVSACLESSGLPGHLLELEITESIVMRHVETAITTMESLRDLGVSLAMDDFGTGYSSLAYLMRFPISTLKIDQSFVRPLKDEGGEAIIVKLILSMAQALHLTVVAEGVENASQAAFLKRQGCQLAQGYFFRPPMPKEEWPAYLAESAPPGGPLLGLERPLLPPPGQDHTGMVDGA